MKMQHASFLPSFLPSSTLRIFYKWLTFPVESYHNSRNYKIGDVYSNGFCTSSSISSWQAAVWDLFISKTIESKCNSVPYNWIKMQLRSLQLNQNATPFLFQLSVVFDTSFLLMLLGKFGWIASGFLDGWEVLFFCWAFWCVRV